jgi:hypothetical protein
MELKIKKISNDRVRKKTLKDVKIQENIAKNLKQDELKENKIKYNPRESYKIADFIQKFINEKNITSKLIKEEAIKKQKEDEDNLKASEILRKKIESDTKIKVNF